MMMKREHCALCGASLEYLTTAEDAACSSCGRTWRASIRCPQGHVLCDACHGQEARRLIAEMARNDPSGDPLEIAERMMAHPSMPMLSCDHAFIAAGALLAALRNSPYDRLSDSDVREAFSRIEQQARGGYCALTGVCGIVPAVGAVFSVFLGARCGSDREQRITMEAVTRTMGALTRLTGPSCCRAYVRAALPVAVELFAESFGIVLPAGEAVPVCVDAERHPHGCRRERCPYYREPPGKDAGRVVWMPGMACTT